MSHTNQLTELVAKEREHRAELVRLAKVKRQLVIKVKDKDGLTFQQIAAILGIKTRAGAERIYAGRNEKKVTV